jgi:peroxiredoxin
MNKVISGLSLSNVQSATTPSNTMMICNLIRIRYWVSAVLLAGIALTGCNSPSTPHQPAVVFENLNQEPLQTYQWSSFRVLLDSSGLQLFEYSVETTRRVRHKRNDSVLFLLPFDTLPFDVLLIPKDTGQLTIQMQMQARGNPNFNEEWKNLEPGVRPTPLTQNQAGAFKSFSNFRMLDQPLPNFELPFARGGTCTPKDFTGKITVLNFWYAACLPCVAEIPALNALKAQYEGDEHVQFISFFADSIAVDENDQLLFARPRLMSSAGNAAPKAFDFHFEQVMNTKPVNPDFNVLSYPTNLVIDEEGIIRHISHGAAIEGNNESLLHDLGDAMERLKKPVMGR